MKVNITYYDTYLLQPVEKKVSFPYTVEDGLCVFKCTQECLDDLLDMLKRHSCKTTIEK